MLEQVHKKWNHYLPKSTYSTDSLCGILNIDSKAGRGTSIRIKLPLTLAIIPSQLISVGKERFAIPQINIDELPRIPAP